MPTSGPTSRPRTATPSRSSDRPGVAEDAGRRDAWAHQGGRCERAEPDGPFAYPWKYREGGQHELIGRPPRDGGDFQILLDGDALAKESDYFKFGGTRHSPDHRLEAWSADLRGSEYFTIRVRRWQTGEDLPDIVEQTSGNVVWGRDSTFFLYVHQDENHRPLKVYRHRLGTAQADDVLVYEEKDSGWFTRVDESASGRFAIVGTGDHDTSERG